MNSSPEYSHWSKDIIFVISDNYLDGMHVWLGAYHKPSDTSMFSDVFEDNFLNGHVAWDVEPLSLTSGVIWTALNIDYPGHSFSHLGVFRGATCRFTEDLPLSAISNIEGLNGRLPNQDLINSFKAISQYTGSVPVLLYDHYEPSEFPGREEIRNFYPSWLPNWLWGHGIVLEYGYRAKNILRHFAYQARGRASGPHGSFHQ